MEDYTGQKGFRIHSHERDDRVGNNYSPDTGEIRTIWDELCKYCVGDNRRVELLA